MPIYQNGKPLPDRILITPREPMHTGVAVANFLKILAEANPELCLQDWRNVVTWGDHEFGLFEDYDWAY